VASPEERRSALEEWREHAARAYQAGTEEKPGEPTAQENVLAHIRECAASRCTVCEQAYQG